MSLEDIREQKTSIWVYIIIGLLLVGMAGFGTSQFGTGSGSTADAVMSAGEAEISQIEYDNTVRNIQQRSPSMDAKEAQQVALSSLQQRVALADYLNRYPLVADNAVVDEYISSNPSFFDGGKFSEEQFRRVIRVAPDVYRRSLSKDLAMQSFQQTVTNTAVVSNAELAPYTELNGLSRDILVAKIAQSNFPNTANDEEINAFYEKNKANYMTDEQVNIEFIDFNPEDIATGINVSEEEVLVAAAPERKANYYLFTDEAKAKAAYDAVQGGQALADVIKNMADSIEDKDDLGTIAKTAGADALIPQNAVDAIYALADRGAVTAPLTIDGAVYLFELTDKGDAVITDAQKVAAKKTLQAEKALPQINAMQEKLNKAVFESGSPSLENIAEQTTLTIDKSGLLASNSNQGILAIPELVSAIANSDKAIGKLQDPVSVGERVIIYRLTEVKAPEQKPLVAVKSEVESTVIADKTAKQVEAAADKLVEAAKASSLTAAAQAAGYPTQAVADFKGRGGDENAVIDQITAILIAQQAPALGDKNAQKLLSPLGDAYVVVSTDIRLGETKADDEMTKTTAQQLAQQLGGLELSSFIQSLTERAEIKVKTAVLEQ